ncbi:MULTISPECIES: type I restriction endonuclease subunit R, EcoR124 family [Lactobacillaceae]|uniref:type I restriction endonuclease subunit R, EcoR124 family n=1 Tax=Lactobacillaceae TaxID=33958 RepID=UPI00080C7E9A|nr:MULTISPECIES: HsdR family type I site-specific deoxyribonuclease [Lactobacillaceae]ANU52212.1 restriction endonuclease subunit R [Limosilactobacillus reuteri]OXE60058.1 restriction endonuclease subunit R [Limosilactobacillus reuteri]QQR13835.1 type I restriction endonuclease subunit R [Limosilactobacillus reuteri]
MQQELQMEAKLIQQLTRDESQWTLREDLKNEDDLWDNFFKILQNNNRSKLNDIPLTENEKASIKAKINHSTFFKAAQDFTGANGQYRVEFQRDDTTLEPVSLLVINHTNIAGGTSVYEVVHQIQLGRRQELDNDRRGDVTLLINGLPVIHIELKTPKRSFLQAFNQIQKYITEQKFNGIYSNIQMFVVTNGTDTKYVAADQHLREKFLSGWVDKDNNPVRNYLDFAKDVLSIPTAHRMVADYSVLDSKQKHIILLRPYQIHAIEAIFEASGKQQSGFIWHTTGSGKTLTSYRVAHNLLSIPSLEKVIFLIDRKDLDNQTTQAFQAYANNDSIDVDETESTINLAKKLTSSDRIVLVTTRQKLQHLFKWQADERNEAMFKRLKNLKLAFIVDECHRTISPMSKMSIDKFFNIQPLWYGFTGTPIFPQNSRDENGKAARTTEQLYGPCLHSYTIKDAIRDKAVLGFHINDMQNVYQDDNTDEAQLKKQYISDQHMNAVADSILKLSYRNLGMQNINNRGYTYSAILTTSPREMRPIDQAKRYYELFRDIKSGNSSIKVPKRIKEVLPDFPKVAITFSVTENEDDSVNDQDFMKDAINDYNHEYGTSFSLDEVGAYNKNINDRLARKNDAYKPQSERLDLVIVVDRLLTGFDSQYLSTLFVDRPPMNPQNIIQAFSRTNRIFDQDKKFGNIVTFQYPQKFSEAIDDALQLYSQGGIGDVLAPTWKESKEKFDQSFNEINNYLEPDAEQSILDAPEEEQKNFIKQYQEFDKAFAAIQTYDEFDDVDPAETYGLTQEKLDSMQGVYETLVDQFKKEKDDDNDDEFLDIDYELESVIDKSVNYQYILGLIQSYVPDEGELLSSGNDRETNEIEEYINDLSKTNKPLAGIVSQLWQKIKAHPENYAGQQVDQLLNQMIDQAYQQRLIEFADKYNVSLDDLRFVIKNYDIHASKQAGVNQLLSRDAFKKFKEVNVDTDLKRMIDWKKQVRSQLADLYINQITPLIEQ